jgi:hypothetical protein
VIVNCTIANHTTRAIMASSALTVVNSILLRDGVGIELAQSPQTIIEQNAFFGNTTNAVGTTVPGSNLPVDPRVDTTLHLMADSPLIDAGIAGQITTADGADEYRPMP